MNFSSSLLDSNRQSSGLLRAHPRDAPRDGEYRYVRWLGFIERDKATHIGKPVKIRIDRIGRLQSISMVWEEVSAGRHVQGCMTERGVFAVVEDAVRLV